MDHPNVCGLLDFSHAYIMSRFRGLDFREAVGAFAPGKSSARAHRWASDHDRPGLPVRRADRLRHGRSAPADGLGRLPWESPAGLPGTPDAVIVELVQRHWSELDACAATARRVWR